MNHLSRLSVVSVALVGVLVSGCAAMLTGGPLIEDPNGPIGTMTFVNHSSRDIHNVYLTRCSNSTYGGNRLDGPDIEGGGKHTFKMSPGCWSIRIDGKGTRGTKSFEVVANQDVVVTYDGRIKE
ncbi:MAG TPA: hypothetical protein VM925_25075 [Labilithrix sp.]|nr:hypothetical protein [Labilithrix sp.]